MEITPPAQPPEDEPEAVGPDPVNALPGGVGKVQPEGAAPMPGGALTGEPEPAPVEQPVPVPTGEATTPPVEVPVPEHTDATPPSPTPEVNPKPAIAPTPEPAEVPAPEVTPEPGIPAPDTPTVEPQAESPIEEPPAAQEITPDTGDVDPADHGTPAALEGVVGGSVAEPAPEAPIATPETPVSVAPQPFGEPISPPALEEIREKMRAQDAVIARKTAVMREVANMLSATAKKLSDAMNQDTPDTPETMGAETL